MSARISLPDALLPYGMMEGMQEKGVLAVSEFIVNVAKGATDNYIKGQFKLPGNYILDPNPGDRGCQKRGYLLYRFSGDPDLKAEAVELRDQIEKMNVTAIKVSKKMEFLLQCYLLAQLRVTNKILENGIVMTKTEVSLLGKKRVGLMPKQRDLPLEASKKICDVAAARISLSSVQLLIEEARRIDAYPPEEKALLLRCLEGYKQPVIEGYDPKTFGNIFYEYKAIVVLLRASRAVIGFRSIVPEGTVPFPNIYMRPHKAGGEFSRVPDEENLSEEIGVIFQGVMNPSLSREEFAARVAQVGPSRLILEAGAIEPPFDDKSQLEEIEDETARGEIERYRQYAKEDGCETEVLYPKLFMVWHVYCTKIGDEVRK